MAVGSVTFGGNISRTICLMTGQTSNNGAPSGASAGVPTRNDENTPSAIEGAFYTVDTPETSTLAIDTTAGTGTMVGTFTLWGYLAASATWYPILINGGVALAETSADHIAYTEEVSVGRFNRLYLQLASVGGTATAFEAFLTTARRDDNFGALRAAVATNTSGIQALTTNELSPAMGAIHFDDGGGATSIALVNTWTKAANTSTGHSLYNFSAPSDNRLQYDGDQEARCIATSTLSFTCASNNQIIEFAIFVNGADFTPSISRQKIGTGTDVASLTVMACPLVTTGDYLEIFVRNLTSDADVTIVHGHLRAEAYYPNP